MLDYSLWNWKSEENEGVCLTYLVSYDMTKIGTRNLNQNQ